MDSQTGRATQNQDTSVFDEVVVQAEVSRLRTFAKELSLEDLREGLWFSKLLRFSLDNYVKEVDAAYFRAKYPDLPADAIVDARIQLAARYSSIEGGLSAGAYTGAVAATIGSGGGASPLTLPAGGATFVVDLLFTSQVQLRLAHDIAVLYRVPLDLRDPEDLWKLVRIAYAIKAGEASRGLVSKGAPALVRPIVKKVIRGGTLTTLRNFPAIGKYLLQRNIIKFGIPLVGVPLSAGVNYWTTKVVGTHAAKVFRTEARIAEAAQRMTERTDHHAELLWVVWLVIKSDDKVHENERLLLTHVTTNLGETNDEFPALGALRSTIDLDHESVWTMLESAIGDLGALYEAGVIAAAVDGKIHAEELKNLRRLAEACSASFDEHAIKDAAKAMA